MQRARLHVVSIQFHGQSTLQKAAGVHLRGCCNGACRQTAWGPNYRVPHRQPGEATADEVLPGLWVGNVDSLLEPLLMQQIQAVVTAFPQDRVSEEQLAACLAGKQHLRVRIDDRPDAPLETHLDEVADWIAQQRRQGNTVLIHCFGGHSRSASFTIYYMVKYFPRLFPSVARALAALRLSRPSVRPNGGFLQKLEIALNELRHERSVEMQFSQTNDSCYQEV